MKALKSIFCFGCFILILSLSNQNSTAQSAKFNGYSIFHETMVDMTWQEIKKAAEKNLPVLIPIAVIEEHGPHMSSGVDTYLGYEVCRQVRRELAKQGVEALIAPPFYWGINSATNVFPGSFTVRKETMKALLKDIHTSFKSWGFTDIYHFIAHGDGQHNQTTFESVIENRKSLNMNLYIMFSEDNLQRSGLTGKEPFLLVHKSAPMEMGQYADLHAGRWETGAVAAYFPELLNEDIARKQKPTTLGWTQLGEWVSDIMKTTPLGYLGDPASFSMEEGKKSIETDCKFIADAIAKKYKK
jgi:creatinine amidohydrolase